MEKIALIYKALSEEIRLRIVMLLMHGELCVCDLMEIFGETQSKISRHLAYLKHSGFVQSRRVGTWMHYSLKEHMDSTIEAQIAFMRERFSEMDIFIDDLKKMEEVKRLKLCEDSKSVVCKKKAK
ncbi:MAG: metalloregulator ArsR/SmtB family transcription factor [Syntrophorhabdaceae bacterium]|nr:metalloregulator ArsR/SmtB family transcription factor [Syntrophorhabdaceae bacterium]